MVVFPEPPDRAASARDNGVKSRGNALMTTWDLRRTGSISPTPSKITVGRQPPRNYNAGVSLFAERMANGGSIAVGVHPNMRHLLNQHLLGEGSDHSPPVIATSKASPPLTHLEQRIAKLEDQRREHSNSCASEEGENATVSSASPTRTELQLIEARLREKTIALERAEAAAKEQAAAALAREGDLHAALQAALARPPPPRIYLRKRAK